MLIPIFFPGQIIEIDNKKPIQSIMPPMSRIIAIAWFLFVIITSLVIFPLAVLIWLATILFDRRLKALHLLTCFWASLYTWVMPSWPISVSGKEKIRRDEAYVIVSNHQSQLDILAFFRLFIHFKWVSKIEIFRVPVIGWNMRLNRYIKLKRGDRESIKSMMADSERTLAEGSSVFIFPEGTRSHDGMLKKFKMGAFELAKKMKVPILPIVINGTRDALPKHSINYHGSHPIRIRILDELQYREFCDLSVEMLSQRVWKLMDEALETL